MARSLVARNDLPPRPLSERPTAAPEALGQWRPRRQQLHALQDVLGPPSHRISAEAVPCLKLLAALHRLKEQHPRLH